jgi:hypothetical protein
VPFTPRKLRCKLPDGRVVVFREMSGTDELHALRDVGKVDDAGEAVRVSQFAQVWRSIVSIDGKPVDRTGDAKSGNPLATPLGFRDQFSLAEWELLEAAYGKLNGVSLSQREAFLAECEIFLGD